jgi:hypothetical protein
VRIEPQGAERLQRYHLTTIMRGINRGSLDSPAKPNHERRGSSIRDPAAYFSLAVVKPKDFGFCASPASLSLKPDFTSSGLAAQHLLVKWAKPCLLLHSIQLLFAQCMLTVLLYSVVRLNSLFFICSPRNQNEASPSSNPSTPPTNAKTHLTRLVLLHKTENISFRFVLRLHASTILKLQC